jgi:peptidyl-tRNA hydrolase
MSKKKSYTVKSGDKLYLVTRRDLGPGYQAVQSCHVVHEFARCCPAPYNEWLGSSSYLALLSVSNEMELMRLLVKASDLGLRTAAWHEPDCAWEITAIAIEAHPFAASLCRKLPLALSEYEHAS